MIVWLASYPRSGNTFLRVVLNQALGQATYSIYDDLQDIAADDATAAVVGHQPLPRGFSIDKARAAKRRYLIKTHELAPEHADKAIYVVRDGRASIWSYKNYRRDYELPDQPLSEFFEGKVMFGSWGDHLRSWQPSKRPDTLLLHFESLVKHPAEAAAKIASFLNLRRSAAKVDRFQKLQSVNPRMFRSGDNQAWVDHFTVREHHQFWQVDGDVMARYGYKRDVL